MSRLISQKDTRGFTLIELILAMTIFSVLFILTTVGFVGINRTYNRGAIKKQLSESIQRLNDDLYSVLQVPQASVPQVCAGDDSPGCPNGYSAICFIGSRYVWSPPMTGTGGFYQDSKNCDEPLDKNSAKELVDSRFVVEDLSVNSIKNSNDLYRARGVVRTQDLAAFTISDNQESVDRLSDDFDPYALRCKGSSAGAIVRTCAIQQFEIIISSRGKPE